MHGPGEPSGPISLNQSAPPNTMYGTLARRADVVDDGRRVVEAVGGWERRLEARLAALALQRVEQRRLLAADVGAGAAVHGDFAVEAGAEDVPAQVPARVRFAHCGEHPPDRVHGLAADVDERVFGADRVAGDDDALDHRVRVVHHQRQIAAGARLALVGVDHDVVRLRRRFCGMKPHFMPVGKPAPPRPRRLESLHSVDELIGVLREGALRSAGVAVQRLVVGDLPRLVVPNRFVSTGVSGTSALLLSSGRYGVL